MKVIELIHYENTLTKNTYNVTDENYNSYLDSLNNQRDIGVLSYTKQMITHDNKTVGAMLEIYL